MRRAVCFLLAAAAGAALASPLSPAAPRPATAVFKATFAASVSTALEFRGVSVREGCTYETTGDASGSYALASGRPTTTRAVARGARRSRRIAFAGAVRALTATVALSGAVTRTTGIDCVADAGVVCDPPPRSRVANLSVRFSMRRNGTIVFESLEDERVRRAIGGCAGPAARLGDVRLASGRLSPRRLLDARVKTIVVRGSSATETPVAAADVAGTVQHTISWTLTLRRQRTAR